MPAAVAAIQQCGYATWAGDDVAATFRAKFDPQRIPDDTGMMYFGVDSLMMLEMQSELGVDFQTALPISALFDHPTLSQLASYLVANHV